MLAFWSHCSPNGAQRNDNINIETDQFSDEFGYTVEMSVLDDDVAALDDITVLAKTLSQGLEDGVWASVCDYANSWEFGLLLRH